jgi:biopolymer transport protein ExbD
VSQITSLVQTLAKGGPVMMERLATRLEREPIDPAQLTARLPARARSGPDPGVVTEADTEVPHGRVVEVMDAVRLAGVGKLAIAVTPREARR